MLFLCVNYIKCFSKEIWWIIMCIYFLYLIWVQTPSIYGSHGVKFAFFKRENIFFMCILKTIFPKTVFPKTCFVFPIFIGGEACFLTLIFMGELLLFIGRVVSIFYGVELFCVSFILYFLLTFVAYVFYLFYVWVAFVNTWQKAGEIDEMWESCLFCIGGVEIVFKRGRI